MFCTQLSDLSMMLSFAPKIYDAYLRVGHVHAAHDHDEREDKLEDGKH